MHDLHAFLASRHFHDLPANDARHPRQIGKRIQAITPTRSDWSSADIVLVGCGEQRGSEGITTWSHAADAIREELYRMYDWHTDIQVADLGNILEGASIGDTRAALRTVLSEIKAAGKIAIILGGAQDLTLQQYDVFKAAGQTINAAVIDMLIDLEDNENISDSSFLMDMLTTHPNFIKHYSHIGFQSYYVNPQMLETLDKLRFDCYRLGRVREDLEEMEPVLRSCDLLSIDMNVLRHAEAPFLQLGSPNGLLGDELCQLVRYAGMSNNLSSLGIYGYHPQYDPKRMGARLIAQMLWYFVDGYLLRQQEASLDNEAGFQEFQVAFTGNDTKFLKSKRSGRWWMQLPEGGWIPCSYNDYVVACNDEVPERWFREQERIV